MSGNPYTDLHQITIANQGLKFKEYEPFAAASPQIDDLGDQSEMSMTKWKHAVDHVEKTTQEDIKSLNIATQRLVSRWAAALEPEKLLYFHLDDIEIGYHIIA